MIKNDLFDYDDFKYKLKIIVHQINHQNPGLDDFQSNV
jgi:hypothetical protein